MLNEKFSLNLLALFTCAIPPTNFVLTTTLSSSALLNAAFWAARTRLSDAFFTAFPAICQKKKTADPVKASTFTDDEPSSTSSCVGWGLTCSLLMASESWSAFTLQATSSWAVEAATCLAEEMSFSSLAWPCTEALAASHRLLVAAATIRAWRRIPNDSWWNSALDIKKRSLLKWHTYSGDEPLGPLSIILSIGRDQTHFALSHQLSLCSRGRFDQSTGGCSDGLGRFQDLLLEVQGLICLLRWEENIHLNRTIVFFFNISESLSIISH